MRYVYILCLILPLYPYAQELGISLAEIRQHVKLLSSSQFEGRLAGTMGCKKAAAYISDAFQQIGLHPYDEDYYQEVPLRRVYWQDVYMKTASHLLSGESFIFKGNKPLEEETEFEVVFGGSGSEAELQHLEVEGRLVFVLLQNLRSYYHVNELLADRGAEGIIMANPYNEAQFESIYRGYQSFQQKRRVTLDRQIQDTLVIPDITDFLNRYTIPAFRIADIHGISTRKLLDHIENKTTDQVPVGVVTVKCNRISEQIISNNVIGIIPGTSEKEVLITAHYDHLGMDDNQIYHGADDNASGVAAMVELAKYFKTTTPTLTMKFIATTAEESGLYGAIEYTLKDDFDPEKVVAVFNMDMISRMDDRHKNLKYLYELGADRYSIFEPALVHADSMMEKIKIERYPEPSSVPLSIYSRSDHFPFAQHGIPSLFFFAGLHDDYHLTTDTADKINYRRLSERTELIGYTIETFIDVYDLAIQESAGGH